MYGRWYEPLVYLTTSLHNLTYVVIHDCLVLCNKFRTRAVGWKHHLSYMLL